MKSEDKLFLKLVVGLVVGVGFLTLYLRKPETSDSNQEPKYENIHPGMTKQQVLATLGQPYMSSPWQRGIFEDGEELIYGVSDIHNVVDSPYYHEFDCTVDLEVDIAGGKVQIASGGKYMHLSQAIER
jgi:hypothetical protein